MPSKKVILSRLFGFIQSGVKKAIAATKRVVRVCCDPCVRRWQFIPSNVKSVIARDAVIGFLLIVVIVLFKLWFEETKVGLGLESLCYAKLQRQLIPPGPPSKPTVAVLDISGIPTSKFLRDDGTSGECTPREPILKIITALTELEHPPSVILVDIDF